VIASAPAAEDTAKLAADPVLTTSRTVRSLLAIPSGGCQATPASSSSDVWTLYDLSSRVEVDGEEPSGLDMRIPTNAMADVAVSALCIAVGWAVVDRLTTRGRSAGAPGLPVAAVGSIVAGGSVLGVERARITAVAIVSDSCR